VGSGIIIIISKSGRPLPDHQVTIDWNWLGLATGTQRATTNNLGKAVFNGNPAFSDGHGAVKGPIGQFANFSVGSNHVGDFSEQQVQVNWNPIESAAQTAKGIGSSILKGLTQILLLVVIVGVVVAVLYTILKRSPLGQFSQLASRIKGAMK
jgi:hypothetical protein